MNGDFFSDFLMDNFGDADIVIAQGHAKVGIEIDFVGLNIECNFDDPFLFDAVNIQFAFGAHGNRSGFAEIYGFDDFSAKGSFRKTFAFHVIFIKMLLLQRAVEAGKRIHFYGKCETLVAGVDQSAQVAATGTDHFQWCFGLKMNRAFIRAPNTRRRRRRSAQQQKGATK